MNDVIAARLGGRAFGSDTTVYKFEAIKRAKAAAVAANPTVELIDLGVGEPDRPADSGVVAALGREAGRSENRFYADNGIDEFQHAAAAYLKAVYGVTVPAATSRIVHGSGSKPILAMLPLCFVDPGDIVLTTVPGYPVIATHTRYLGGEVHPLPLIAEAGYHPDLEGIPSAVLARSKLLYLNYPNNPTGAVATEDLYQRVIGFATRHGIVVVVDAAYGALVFDRKPLSILQLPGAWDVAVEVHSLSKAFNMTGWRLGFAVGNPRFISAFATVKDNTDSGQFRAIQKAGIYALEHPQLTVATRDRYARRLRALVGELRSAGFAAEMPGGSFFCYCKAPVAAGDTRFASALDFTTYLIEHSLISAVPWDDAGACVRFSATFEARDEADEQRVIAEVGRRLRDLRLTFG